MTLRQVLIHQQQRQSGAGQQQQRGQGEGDGPSTVLEGVGSSSSGSSSWNVHAVARGLQLPGWLLASREQKKERQLQHTVRFPRDTVASPCCRRALVLGAWELGLHCTAQPAA